MSFLITPTLLDAYAWFNNAPASWKSKAFKDFSNKLNRTKWDPTPAIKRGIEYEAKVYRFCNKPLDSFEGSDIFKETCQEIKDGLFQKTLKKIIVVDDKEYLLYGKTDAWFTDIIKDLKTTKSYKGQSKYLNGWQHIIYCYIANIPRFRYVVVEWDDSETDETKLTPGELFKIDYTMESRAANKEKIINGIKDIIEFINGDDELTDAYYKRFNLYG